MKNTTWRLMVVVAALAGLTSSLSTAQIPAAAQQQGMYLEWRFDSGADPAPPSVASPAGDDIQADITVGKHGMGWQPQFSYEMGDATGVWDLGQSGTIALSLGASASARTITLQVWQWLDGGIYADYATVSVPGATQAAVSASSASSCLGGDWMVQQTDWQVTDGAAANAVLITGLSSGSLVDKVVVKATSAALEPLVLSIRQLDGTNLEISWPVAAGSGALESSTDLGDSQSWAAVNTQPQVSGDRYTVTIQAAADNMQFFRLMR